MISFKKDQAGFLDTVQVSTHVLVRDKAFLINEEFQEASQILESAAGQNDQAGDVMLVRS